MTLTSRSTTDLHHWRGQRFWNLGPTTRTTKLTRSDPSGVSSKRTVLTERVRRLIVSGTRARL